MASNQRAKEAVLASDSNYNIKKSAVKYSGGAGKGSVAMLPKIHRDSTNASDY